MGTKILGWSIYKHLFHWSLVGLLCLSHLFAENPSAVHRYVGYAILALVLVRVSWWILVRRYRRYLDAIKVRVAVITQNKNVLETKSESHSGHTSLGGIVIFAMILTLLVTAVSGIKLISVMQERIAQPSVASLVANTIKDDEQNEPETNSAEVRFWGEVHEIGAKLMLVLILFHLIAVVVSSKGWAWPLLKGRARGAHEKSL